MNGWARWRPLVAYLVLGFGVVGAFALYGSQRQSFRRQVCHAILDERKTLAGLIGAAVPPVQPVDESLPPAIRNLVERSRERTQAFLDDAQRRLSTPVAACRDTGIDTRVTVHGATPIPVRVDSTSTTSTTSAPRRRSTSTTRPRRRARTPTTRPAAPGPGPSPTTRPSPTTSTTRQPLVCVVGRCVG